MNKIKIADTDVAINRIFKERWSPRSFAEKDIEIDTLKQIFEAARWSPSAFNEQPWRFLVGIKSNNDEVYNDILNGLDPWNQEWAKSAAVLVIGLAKQSFSKNGKSNAYADYDLGQAMAHLTMQAQMNGLYVHQMAGILPNHIIEKFKLDDEYQPRVAAAIGYVGDSEALHEKYQEAENAKRERIELKNLVFERFNHSFF